MKLRKTLFLSEARPTTNLNFSQEAPVIFYDIRYRKWVQDLWYFDYLPETKEQAKQLGYLIR